MKQFIHKYCKKVRADLSIVLLRDLVAEFLGTFFIVSVPAAIPMPWNMGLGGPVQVALGIGFAVMVMVGALAEFGGAHMNPCVTICFALRMDITVFRAILYIPIQCLGAVAGAGFVHLVTPAHQQAYLGLTLLGEDVKPVQGVFIEMWITAIMMTTIYGFTDVKRKGTLFMPAIPIGLSVSLGIMAAFASTGGSMNPARSFGPVVVTGKWQHHWVYWVGPISGGILITFIYFVFDKVESWNPCKSSKTQKCREEKDTKETCDQNMNEITTTSDIAQFSKL